MWEKEKEGIARFFCTRKSSKRCIYCSVESKHINKHFWGRNFDFRHLKEKRSLRIFQLVHQGREHNIKSPLGHPTTVKGVSEVRSTEVGLSTVGKTGWTLPPPRDSCDSLKFPPGVASDRHLHHRNWTSLCSKILFTCKKDFLGLRSFHPNNWNNLACNQRGRFFSAVHLVSSTWNGYN